MAFPLTKQALYSVSYVSRPTRKTFAHYVRCGVFYPKTIMLSWVLLPVVMETRSIQSNHVCGNGSGVMDTCYVVEGRVRDPHLKFLLLQLQVSLGDTNLHRSWKIN